jgi:hypothetical protein
VVVSNAAKVGANPYPEAPCTAPPVENTRVAGEPCEALKALHIGHGGREECRVVLEVLTTHAETFGWEGKWGDRTLLPAEHPLRVVRVASSE